MYKKFDYSSLQCMDLCTKGADYQSSREDAGSLPDAEFLLTSWLPDKLVVDKVEVQQDG